MSIFRSIKIQQTVCFTNQLLLVKPYKVQTCQIQFPFAEVFFECNIQQENNNSDGPILAIHWKRYLFGFLLFYGQKMTDYLLHSCHGLFFLLF